MSTIPRRLLPQAVTIRAYEGSGAYGDVFSAAMTYPARVARENKLVRNRAGDEVVASSTIITVPAVDCPPGSKVKLPGETSERTTITYAPHIGARKVHHVEIDVA